MGCSASMPIKNREPPSVSTGRERSQSGLIQRLPIWDARGRRESGLSRLINKGVIRLKQLVVEVATSPG